MLVSMVQDSMFDSSDYIGPFSWIQSQNQPSSEWWSEGTYRQLDHDWPQARDAQCIQNNLLFH